VLDGKVFQQVIEPEGGWFRAMPATCPDTNDLSKITEDDSARLAAHRFDEVLRLDHHDPGDGILGIQQIDPQTFSENCLTR
jgi:hypothetical protein